MSAGPRVSRPDTTSFLTVLLTLLVAVPSDIRVSALGGAGAPAGLLALVAGLVWLVFRLLDQRPYDGRGLGWLRLALLLLLVAVLASFVVAMLRPIPFDEASQANLGVLRVLAFLGLALLVIDGMTGWGRFTVLLRRICLAGGLLALLGIAQFVTGSALIDGPSVVSLAGIPGVTSAQDFASVVARGDFTRSAGTAMSPLEYAFVLAAVFPIALTLALFDDTRSILRRWTPVALISVALLVSVSRSGLVGLAIGGVVLLATWPRRLLVPMSALGLALLVGIYVTVPGLAGTMRNLFSATEADPSAQSRSSSSAVVTTFLGDPPILGRGFGTFLPQYRILDNQYLGLLVETGALGLLAFLLVLLAAGAAATQGAREADGVLQSQLGRALTAAIVSCAVLTGLFDMLAFPMAAGLLSLLVGCCGAYRRLVGSASARRGTLSAPSGQRLLVYCAGLEWHGVKGTDRHLVEQLAGRVDVLWVDPPVSVLRTLGRGEGEGARWGVQVADVLPGVRRLSVVAPPLASRRGVRPLTQWLLRRSIRGAVARDGREVWAFVSSRPEPVLTAVPASVRAYFATDDFVAGADLLGLSAERMARAESEQLRTADLLLAVSPQITSRWRALGREGGVLPNGCDAQRLAHVPETARASVPLPFPAAGVVGQFSARIDLALLEAVADHGSPLLLVGPVDPGLASDERWRSLITRPDVHWAGRQEFDAVPGYLACLGVGLTPYTDSDFNRASFPLKTLEYLAAGLPVVSTPLPAVEALNTNLVRTADTPEGYAVAVAEELAASDVTGSVARARQQFAAGHDWQSRGAELLSVLEVAAARVPRDPVTSAAGR